MTFNVHLLLHLAESVYNWGPLWAHSAFAFESGNGQLLKNVNKTTEKMECDTDFDKEVHMPESTSIIIEENPVNDIPLKSQKIFLSDEETESVFLNERILDKDKDHHSEEIKLSDVTGEWLARLEFQWLARLVFLE
ncbi:uncharacterized protein LOC122503198 [Leptopilina heterotoma]|uniref:uncharacterized protein LOC122503198 n=1 Tax=Leptopilina heterotoma TaxID=63436 RepID=UPI001CA81244|nr:uncharacterized protein LOC122503198 [Leptopilina heterotoma]